MDDAARLEALEAENERLRDEMAFLKERLGLSFVAPLQWGLTPAEMRLFGRLMKGGTVTKDGLMGVLYRDLGKEEAEPKIVDVFVCKIRKKIAPFGLSIATRWGLGYELPLETIALVNGLLPPQPRDQQVPDRRSREALS